MQVTTDESGYISGYATEGELTGGTQMSEPEDLSHFVSHWQSYKVQDDTLVFDEAYDTTLNEESEKENLRLLRQTECFSVVDRGKLWYSTLTKEQLSELTAWYNSWLNVTETKSVPEKPEWLR